MRNFRHIEGVLVAAKFSREENRQFRYRLEVVRSAVSSGKTVCLVMQNPSYADESISDQSVSFMEKIVFENSNPAFRKVRRLIVVNQFALVKTSGFLGREEDIGQENDAEIEKALRESDIVVLGWGASNRFDVRKCFVLGLLKEMPGKKIYKTRVHPSRGSYSEDFILPFVG